MKKTPLNLKLVILLEYQKYKNVFAKGYAPFRSEERFVIKKVKNTVLRALLMILIEKKLLVLSTKKN